MCLEKFRIIAVLFQTREEQYAQLWLAPERVPCKYKLKGPKTFCQRQNILLEILLV